MLQTITDRLNTELSSLSFSPPVTHVYNPLEYASAPYSMYLERFGTGPKEFVFLGMNPGPFGMAQTGIPFGEVQLVRDWMGINAPVRKPSNEHPKRPVLGFDCPRREVSGRRLWTWVSENFGRPENFFKRGFVLNYCPLVFLEETGRNRTPDRLPAAERRAVIEPCDAALRQIIETLQARVVVGVGKFAEDRAKIALDGVDVQIGRIAHPSPANPAANRGWSELASTQLAELGFP